MRSITDIAVHCSATNGDLDIGVYQIDEMHRRRKFHFTNAKGQVGHVGYHYVVRLNGDVEEGRPLEIVGAHVQGHNLHSIGICLIGGLDRAGKPAMTYTEAQMRSLEILVAGLLDRFPGARVRGHRDFSPDLDGDGVIERHEWLKDCPCFDVPAWAKERGLVPRLS